MSDWQATQKKYLGKVFIKRGTKQRFIVCDTTLGGSLVLIRYRLRNSVRKFNSYEWATLPVAVVESTMNPTKGGQSG